MEPALLLTFHDLRRRRLILGVAIHELARVVHTTPTELMDIEAGLAPFSEPDVYERAFAAILRKTRR